VSQIVLPYTLRCADPLPSVLGSATDGTSTSCQATLVPAVGGPDDYPACLQAVGIGPATRTSGKPTSHPERARLCPRRAIRPERLLVIDLLIVSHRHRDHFDLASLDRMGRDCEVLCPPDPVIVGAAERESFLNKGESG
jgi:hypothetical protein